MIDDYTAPDSKTAPNKNETNPADHLNIWDPSGATNQTPEPGSHNPANPAGNTKKPWWKPSWHPKNLTKKQKIIALAVAIVVLIGASAGAWAMLHKKPPPVAKLAVVQKKAEPPAPTTVASKLSGLPVAPEVNQRPVTGVMIENSPDARPQSGLNSASVVFEAIAEGGITRFLALFQDTQPDYIGPVRSARPYYLEWLMPFDAALAHAGGSPDALAAIKSLGVKDLDQFANSGTYQRVSSRFAPHNLYTSTASLNALEQKKGYGASNFDGFPRKAEAPVASPPARTIDLKISSYLYDVHYDYDATIHAYKRGEGGKGHLDEKSRQQIAPKVVVAMVIPHGIMADKIHYTYATTGSGKVYVFQDGNITEGTWNKTGTKAQITFTGTDGKPLALNPGQTWITMVSDPASVTHGP